MAQIDQDGGDESGLGDASLLGRWTALHRDAEKISLGVNLLGDWLRDTLDPKLRV